MIRGIDHIELIVRDLSAYITFVENLGFELLTGTTHHGCSVETHMPGRINSLRQHIIDKEGVSYDPIAGHIERDGYVVRRFPQHEEVIKPGLGVPLTEAVRAACINKPRQMLNSKHNPPSCPWSAHRARDVALS